MCGACLCLGSCWNEEDDNCADNLNRKETVQKMLEILIKAKLKILIV